MLKTVGSGGGQMQPCCGCTRYSQLSHPCDKQGRRSCFCKVAVAGQTPGWGRFSYNPSKVHGSSGKQSWQEGRKGREVMETSQGRVIREPDQSLVHPSASKLSNKGPVLSHDSTFKNISNICFSLRSLTCHCPAATNTSSSLFKHSLMRKYCHNEPQLKPGVKIKTSTGITAEWACVQKIARRRKTGAIAMVPRSSRGRRGFQILEN